MRSCSSCGKAVDNNVDKCSDCQSALTLTPESNNPPKAISFGFNGDKEKDHFWDPELIVIYLSGILLYAFPPLTLWVFGWISFEVACGVFVATLFFVFLMAKIPC